MNVFRGSLIPFGSLFLAQGLPTKLKLNPDLRFGPGATTVVRLPGASLPGLEGTCLLPPSPCKFFLDFFPRLFLSRC